MHARISGDREQTLLMKWDAVAILLHVLFGLLEVSEQSSYYDLEVRGE